ncbi:MAG: hypothetical protein ACYC2K_12510 [Gemmatimonadales bacterium]
MMTHRSGIALLEAIIGVTILSVAGLAVVAATANTIAAVRTALEVEEQSRAAGAFMHSVALWTRADLERRLGDRPQGSWRLHIDRLSEDRYFIRLSDSTERRNPLLETVLFRPARAPHD